jgi:hypothetical protein
MYFPYTHPLLSPAQFPEPVSAADNYKYLLNFNEDSIAILQKLSLIKTNQILSANPKRSELA